VGGDPVHCFVVHFGLLARSRERQLDALIDWIQRSVPAGAPLIIGGDFNDWRGQLSRRLCDEIDVIEAFDSLRPGMVRTQRAVWFMRDRLADMGMDMAPESLRLPRRVRSARTFPALVPWLRMDRIYLRGFAVRDARVPRGPGWARLSDHSPVIADLERGHG
jgi:endonuclease/exonuclease/phosphatase family metal-dependent hydrolase